MTVRPGSPPHVPSAPVPTQRPTAYEIWAHWDGENLDVLGHTVPPEPDPAVPVIWQMIFDAPTAARAREAISRGERPPPPEREPLPPDYRRGGPILLSASAGA